MENATKKRLFEQRRLLLYWIKNGLTEADIASFWEQKKIRKIAVYGMGEIGAVVCNVLLKSNVEVAYGIDRVDLRQIGEVIVKRFDAISIIEDVDAVLVTPFFNYGEICDVLREKITDEVKLISLEDMVYGAIMLKNEGK